MYVIDTTLADGTRVTRDAGLQRLVFALPEGVQRKVRKNQRKLLGPDSTAQAGLPWDEKGLVTFRYSGASLRSQPLFCDRRDRPLPRRCRHQVHPGQRVRLSLRLIPRSGPTPSTRLEVLKVQLPLLDGSAGKSKPASPHSIQTVKLSLPVDLMQEVERLAGEGDWSVSAWLRDAIESQVSRQQQQRSGNRSVA